MWIAAALAAVMMAAGAASAAAPSVAAQDENDATPCLQLSNAGDARELMCVTWDDCSGIYNEIEDGEHTSGWYSGVCRTTNGAESCQSEWDTRGDADDNYVRCHPITPDLEGTSIGPASIVCNPEPLGEPGGGTIGSLQEAGNTVIFTTCVLAIEVAGDAIEIAFVVVDTAVDTLQFVIDRAVDAVNEVCEILTGEPCLRDDEVTIALVAEA